jgi:transcriptional regulator with XRE-family HTH domain
LSHIAKCNTPPGLIPSDFSLQEGGCAGTGISFSFFKSREYALISRVYEFRIRKRWTLKRLSQLSGVPLNTIWRMERGYGLTLRNAFSIAAIFGLSVYDLWDIVPAGASAGMFVKDVTSIRRLRLRRHWRLRQLAKASGVSMTTLFAAESGHTPTLENAAKIAAALNVSVYDIWKPPRLNRKLASSK